MQGKTYKIPSPLCNLLQDSHTTVPKITICDEKQPILLSALCDEPRNRPLLVADEKSFAAIASMLSCEGGATAPAQHIFHAPAKPTKDKAAAELSNTISEVGADSLVVVGSGSLSDIGKFCAAKHGLKLTIIATAPSMNGYASANASLIYKGLKQSFPAKMVDHLMIYPTVIKQAPEAMIAAGSADALAAISADMDWHLSHILLGTPYYPEVFEAQLPYFDGLDDPMVLLELLIIQGLGMTAAGSSAPASGGEHMLAHLLEMLEPERCEALLHGELIAITHPIYAAYQQRILASPTPPILRNQLDTGAVKTLLGEKVACNILDKWTDDQAMKIQLELNLRWTFIMQELKHKRGLINKLVSQTTNSHHDGDTSKIVSQLTSFACTTRNRFTMLDLEVK